MRRILWAALCGAAAVVIGCSGGTQLATGGGDGSTGDGSTGDAASTAGTSAGFGGDLGSTGGGTTAASSAGSGSASTATTGAGPWPMQQLTSYGAVNGLAEPIVDVSVDEAENVWAVSHGTLYLLTPGSSAFQAFSAADGLNLGNAADPGIMNVAGGRPGEVFVGYNGLDIDSPQQNGDPAHDAQLKKGGVDHVVLGAGGKLTVSHPDVHSDDYVVGGETDYSFYEDRGTRRMLYDHQFHPGTLYVGWNHGVGRFDWGVTDPVTGSMYADHVHPIVVSTDAQGNATEWMGEWRGLALDPTQNGLLWMGGEYTGGAIDWTKDLYGWTCQRSDCNPANGFVRAWSKQYGQPLFPVAKDGDPMNVRAAAVTHDGTVYFASGPQWNPSADKMYGVAVVQGWQQSYLDPVADMHLPSKAIMDMVAMPDDTLMIAVMNQGLWRYDPKAKTATQVQGVPDAINMLYLDTLVAPAALYVATDSGLSVVRDAK